MPIALSASGAMSETIPPSLGFHEPNPNIDWPGSPFHVNTELTDWKVPAGQVRCAGVSAFGFGGTNFHAVLEEYVPGLHRSDDEARSFASADVPALIASLETLVERVARPVPPRHQRPEPRGPVVEEDLAACGDGPSVCRVDGVHVVNDSAAAIGLP